MISGFSLPGGGLGFRFRPSWPQPTARLRSLPPPSMAAHPRQLGGSSGYVASLRLPIGNLFIETFLTSLRKVRASSPPPGLTKFSSEGLKCESSKRLLGAYITLPGGGLGFQSPTSCRLLSARLRDSLDLLSRALAGSGRPSGSSPPPGLSQAKWLSSLK